VLFKQIKSILDIRPQELTMKNKMFPPVILILSLFLTISLSSCQKYEGHKSQLPLQQGEKSVGEVSLTTDFNILTATRKAKDSLVYNTLLNRAIELYGSKVEIRNMVYKAKFKLFNLLVIEAAGDAVISED
jgi:hypothetical protein